MSFKIKAHTVVFTAYGKDIEEDPESYLKSVSNNVDWVLGQQECCPETKRLHLQCMAHVKNQSRWTFLIKHGDHIEKCQDPIASIKYCTKEETRILGPWEFGTRPTFNIKGQKALAIKNQILIEKNIIDLVKDGDIPFTSVPSIVKAKNIWTLINPGELKKKEENLWIWGEPGCGKTYYVKENFKPLYEKSQNKWWDGFSHEDNVLIDDFDHQGKCLGHLLKIWSDSYHGWKGETKGGTIQPNFSRLIITSNYVPFEIWGGPEGDSQLVSAIERRFKIIQMVNRQLI